MWHFVNREVKHQYNVILVELTTVMVFKYPHSA